MTALAEAEVEYEDHTSASIYVKFPVKDEGGRMKAEAESFFVIWTTTPWTLPANQAIAVHPKFTYRRVKTSHGGLIMNSELIPNVMKAIGLDEKDYEVGPKCGPAPNLKVSFAAILGSIEIRR